MKKVPIIYNHPDVPELAPLALTMVTTAFTPIIYALVCVILSTTCEKGNEYLPFVLLFIIPFFLMLYIAKKKLDQMYEVAKTRGVDEARAMYGKAMVAEVYGNIPAIILLMVLVILMMA